MFTAIPNLVHRPRHTAVSIDLQFNLVRYVECLNPVCRGMYNMSTYATGRMLHNAKSTFFYTIVLKVNNGDIFKCPKYSES